MQQLFQDVHGHFQSNHQYDKFIKEAQKEYDIKIYRLGSFSREYAYHIFQDLQSKYREGEFKQMPLGWHENQRRLYVWFIVCFIHMKMLEPNKLIDLQKYDKHWKNISITFHNKEIPFLKYQLLNIIKNKGRTHWKKEQDQLLQQAHGKFEHGQWNEVAKYFYIHSNELFFKTPKQCRQRWQNHLNKDIRHGDWKDQEDIIILEFVKRKGTKWASIIQELGNTRTQHMIKNRYKSLLNKAQQNKKMSEGQIVLQLLKNLTGPSRNQEVEVVRDQEGIIQVESQQIVDEEPPVIEKKTRKEKKRGRPKKVEKVETKKKEGQEQRKSVHIAPSLNHSFNLNDCRFENNNNNSDMMIDGFSQSRINHPMIYNHSNIFLNDSRNDFFRGNLSFNNHSFIRWQNGDNSLFADPLRSRNSKRQGGFEPVMLEGESLIRPESRKMSIKQSSDSMLFSQFMKDSLKDK